MGLHAGEHSMGRMPPECVALVEALRFRHAKDGRLKSLSAGQWHSLLNVCDRSQATLLLGRYCDAALPDWVRMRIRDNYVSASHRYGRLRNAVFEISQALRIHNVEFVLLKGLTYSQDFAPDPILRSQGDIDLWWSACDVDRARDALVDLGYYSVGKSRGRHLDPMIREKHWNWRGDYYAPDLPIPVDLHYCLWDEEAEKITGPNHFEVWSRRRSIRVDDEVIPTLAEVDVLAFAAVHLLMHLLHGDFRLQRAWEMAYFLENKADDGEFWRHWRRLYSDEFRMTQVVVFSLAQHWFQCRLPSLIEAERDLLLSREVTLWIEQYGFSPLVRLICPNKDELGLNIHLLRSRTARARVLLRRLFPLHSAGPSSMSSRAGLAADGISMASQMGAFGSRVAYHLRTLPAACLHGMRARRIGPKLNER